MSSPVVSLGAGEKASQLTRQICTLYQVAFSRPPFLWNEDESAAQRSRLERLSSDLTFGITAAEVNGEVVGFAYGVALRSDTQWWSGTTRPLPSDVTNEWEGRTFAIIDLAVHEDYRGRGIGRALLDVLLNSREEERATLAVQPVAANTKEFYEHLGWQRIGTTKAIAGAVSPYFDLYLLPLHIKP